MQINIVEFAAEIPNWMPAMIRVSLALGLLRAMIAAAQNQFVSLTPNDGNHNHIDGTFPEGTTIQLIWETTWQSLALVLWEDGTPQFQYLPNSGTLQH